MGADIESGGMTWLIFAVMTMMTWGVYGLLLHSGQGAMLDPVHGRSKAFLFVGVAYFFTAVVAPLLVLKFMAMMQGQLAEDGLWSFVQEIRNRCVVVSNWHIIIYCSV